MTRIETLFGYFLWVSIPTVVVIGLWRGAAAVREIQLRRRFPGLEVLSGLRAPMLQSRIDILRGSPFHIRSFATFPASFSLVFDTSTLSIWGGTIEPIELFRFAWGDVQSLRPVSIAELGRRSNGFELVVVYEGVSVELPIIVTGRGIAGLFPETIDRLTMVAAEFKPSTRE